jgi:hypothetical protein
MAETTAKAPETQLPLFYKNPVLLDGEKHQEVSLNKDIGLGFTATTNAVPVNLIELPQVAHFYPIAFSNDGAATPVAIMGVRNDENLFVNKKGEWQKDAYIPSYIRRYPFILTEVNNGESLSLCIDETDEVISNDNANPLFDADKKPTDLANNAMEFCKSYHAASQQTLEFSKALADSGLLVERTAELVVKGDQKVNFSGFAIIDEEKFNKLDDATFNEWRAKGWIGAIYAHLFSGFHWNGITKLLGERMTN